MVRLSLARRTSGRADRALGDAWNPAKPLCLGSLCALLSVGAALIPEGRLECLIAEPTRVTAVASDAQSVCPFSVTLRNDSSRTLRLIRAVPDCGGTAVRFALRELPAGAATTLRGEISLEPQDRERTQHIVIHYRLGDDESVRRAPLTIVARRQVSRRAGGVG